jgi:hypothetical protein
MLSTIFTSSLRAPGALQARAPGAGKQPWGRLFKIETSLIFQIYMVVCTTGVNKLLLRNK